MQVQKLVYIAITVICLVITPIAIQASEDYTYPQRGLLKALEKNDAKKAIDIATFIVQTTIPDGPLIVQMILEESKLNNNAAKKLIAYFPQLQIMAEALRRHQTHKPRSEKEIEHAEQRRLEKVIK